jgi:hypothetical protein
LLHWGDNEEDAAMVRLWGREWTKRELLARVGDLSQVAGVERFTYEDSVRDGVRAARVRTGGGLDFTVLLSRGMDISHASYNGMPLAWISQTGEAHPHAFEPAERGWLRSFYGGLVTTCGLSNAGMHNEDEGEALGLHGRISHSPAEETGAWTEWDGDEARVIVTGKLREARVFGENLRLRRRIVAPVGGAQLTIEDTVENAGFQTVPLMLLYHLNFGWPLVSEDTEIVVPSRIPAEPRDAEAEKGLAVWNRLEAPQADYAEQCFFHSPAADEDGIAHVLVVNHARDVGVQISFDATQLDHCIEWKMMGANEYVCGVEPANCLVLGRAAERAAGRLKTINPGEERRFRITLSVLDGADMITSARAKAEVNARAQ